MSKLKENSMMRQLDETLAILCSLDYKEQKLPNIEFYFKVTTTESKISFYAIDAGEIDSLISKLNLALDGIEKTQSNADGGGVDIGKGNGNDVVLFNESSKIEDAEQRTTPVKRSVDLKFGGGTHKISREEYERFLDQTEQDRLAAEDRLKQQQQKRIKEEEARKAI